MTDPDDIEAWVRGDPGESIAGGGDLLAAMLDTLKRSRPDWHDDAACRGATIDFTVTRRERNRAAISAALQVCGRCPVRVECLDWAVEIGDEAAVLGGTTPSARRRLARQRTKDDAA